MLIETRVEVDLDAVWDAVWAGSYASSRVWIVIGFLPPGLCRPRVIPRGLHGLRKLSLGTPLHPLFGAGTHVEEDGGRLICFAMQRRGEPRRRKSVAPRP